MKNKNNQNIENHEVSAERYDVNENLKNKKNKKDQPSQIISQEDLSLSNQLSSSYTFEVEKNSTWRKSKSSFLVPIFIGAALVAAPMYFAIEATRQDPSTTPIEKVWAKYDQLFIDSIEPFNPTSDIDGNPSPNTAFSDLIAEITQQLRSQGIVADMEGLDEQINLLITSPSWPGSPIKITLDRLKNLINYKFNFDLIKNDGNINTDTSELVVSFKLSPNPLINDYVITETKSYGLNNDSKIWVPSDNIITFGAGLDNTVFDLFNTFIFDYLQSVSVIDGQTTAFTPDQIRMMFDRVERSPLADENYFGGIFDALEIMAKSSTTWSLTPIEAYKKAFFTEVTFPDGSKGLRLDKHALTSYFHTQSITNGSEIFWWINESNIDIIHLSDIPQFVGTSYDEQSLFRYTLRNNEIPDTLPLEQRWNTYGRDVSPLSLYQIDDKLDEYDELIKFVLEGGVFND